MHQYRGHRNTATIKGVNFFGPKSEYVISGSDCGNVYFWDRNTESVVQWLLADDNRVVSKNLKFKLIQFHNWIKANLPTTHIY